MISQKYIKIEAVSGYKTLTAFVIIHSELTNRSEIYTLRRKWGYLMPIREINPLRPYDTLVWGCLTQRVAYAGTTHSVLVYIPDGVRPSTSGVIILGPNGLSAQEILEKSEWKSLADKEPPDKKMILFIPEPPENGWDIQEEYGAPGGSVGYINSLLDIVMERLHYCVHESKIYLFGRAEGGSLAVMAAAFNPARYAGLVTIDALPVSPSYLTACGEALCTDLYGFEADSGCRWKKGDTPVPYWMIESDRTRDTPAALSYFLRANGSDLGPAHGPMNTEVFSRKRPMAYPINQEVAACPVWHTVRKEQIPISRIWHEFLHAHRRWMGDPCGDLRISIPATAKNVEARCEGIEGYTREWLIYVPDIVKSGQVKNPPLVFALHGYSCSAEIYLGNSGWNKVADSRGLIVIFPSALPRKVTLENHDRNMELPCWNVLWSHEKGPSEFAFFKRMLEDAQEKYVIDRTRVYATGHSMGSLMTSSLVLHYPELFAAAAPCSGVFFESMYEQIMREPEFSPDNTAPIPVWMFAGRNETWLIDSEPTVNNSTGKTILFWHRHNRLPGLAETQFKCEGISYQDRWHDIVYSGKNGAPAVRYTKLDYFPHATMPEMSFRIWDEFFSHWKKEGCQSIWI